MKRILFVLLLAGCAAQPAQPLDAQAAFTQALGASYLMVDSVAQLVSEQCAAPGPGEPCAAGALITSEQRDKAKDALVDALAALDDARTLYNAGSTTQAEDQLAAARRAIAAAKEMAK
jgi:hypothetical protein